MLVRSLKYAVLFAFNSLKSGGQKLAELYLFCPIYPLCTFYSPAAYWRIFEIYLPLALNLFFKNLFMTHL